MKTTTILSSLLLFVAAQLPSQAAPPEAVVLSAKGKELEAKYSKQLESLRAEVIAALPKVDQAKQARFMELRQQSANMPKISDDTPPAERKSIEAEAEKTKLETWSAAGELLSELSTVLDSDKLDPKLMRIAILSHGTPRGFAEFAQKGSKHENLVDQLFADEALMRQVLEAGGANGGEYGEMMEVYTAIQAASERARERGTIFQRLALGMAIQMPWLDAESIGGADGKAGVHAMVFSANGIGIKQVKRYLHYEKAYLDKELDPLFDTLNTWELRYVGNESYSEEDMTWFRQMLRVYRPDHIRTKDYKWRYIRMVKSDVPYTSTTHDPSLGIPAQEHIALGGICGRRAFLGRLCTRSFGIPSRQSTQTGHGAMNHWTPDGWVICLGAWWNIAWCGPWGGLDFLLDSQAREFDDYQIVRRAQWVGDTFAEENVKIGPGNHGTGGGFWKGLAYVKKQLIVDKAKVEALELVGGMKLGESDELIGDEVGEEIEIPEEFTKITVAEDGTINMPAVSCYSPRKSSDRILFMESWEEGYQLHYSRLGSRPELFKYRVEVPAAGEYELVAEAATVSPNLQMLVRVNRDEPVPFDMPYSHGLWEKSEPTKIKLAEGRNTISVTARVPNRGVSIKSWTLKPVK